ncbi:MAG: branched-chain amino acid ABC transporter permease [Alphaproteobacteria bacterium]
MSFEIVASSFQHKDIEQSQFRRTLKCGAIGGGTMVALCVFGLINQFMERWIIENMLSLAHATFIGVTLTVGALIAMRSPKLGPAARVVQGLLVGMISGAILSALILVMAAFDIRNMFVSLSPKLLAFLTYGFEPYTASAITIATGGLLGLIGALIRESPATLRKPVIAGLATAFFIGLFAELLQLAMQYETVEPIRDYMFTWEGQTLRGFITMFVLGFVISLFWAVRGKAVMENHRAKSHVSQRSIRYFLYAIAIVLFLLFPMAAGSFFGQVLMLVGLYVLMGMGLNLEVGLAGLLDLGFVAFFATGAYTIALFTADNENLILLLDRPLTWWEALPLAMFASLLMGLAFGIPVLKVRGDYLAVATMGLGEIIRVVVLSDMASPLLGGSQGLLHIPRPWIGDFELNDPIHLFYLTLISSLIAAYFAWALENSRLGRAWMAIREDEDVGQALGINLVNVKLLAYALGAWFAGLAGAIFAVMLGSIFPHSFQLLISINILALIIVGGIGSLPGVVVGALMLIGTPELLREFGEYRFLAYGFVLIVMMRVKPLGLWPSAVRKRELQSAEEAEALMRAQTGQKA